MQNCEDEEAWHCGGAGSHLDRCIRHISKDNKKGQNSSEMFHPKHISLRTIKPRSLYHAKVKKSQGLLSLICEVTGRYFM